MQSKLEILLSEVDPFEQKIIDIQNYRIGYFIAKDKLKSSSNEDVLFIGHAKDGLILGVSDGAGGHPRGKDASLLIGKTILDGKDISPMDLIEKANENVLALKAGAAATLAFVTIKNDELRCFSVGDSEIILWNAHGREIYSNIPHSNVGYKIEAGVLEQSNSLDEPERHQVNNLIGDKILRIEATSGMTFKKNQTLLIGSDGVFDNFTHEELSEMIGSGSFEESFKKISELCSEMNEESWKKYDDISFIVVRKINA